MNKAMTEGTWWRDVINISQASRTSLGGTSHCPTGQSTGQSRVGQGDSVVNDSRGSLVYLHTEACQLQEG